MDLETENNEKVTIIFIKSPNLTEKVDQNITKDGEEEIKSRFIHNLVQNNEEIEEKQEEIEEKEVSHIFIEDSYRRKSEQK